MEMKKTEKHAEHFLSQMWNLQPWGWKTSHNSPCFLNEADDKFSHFDKLVRLKGDHLLQDEQTDWKRIMNQILVYYHVDMALLHNVPFYTEYSSCIQIALFQVKQHKKSWIQVYLHPRNCQEERDPC